MFRKNFLLFSNIQTLTNSLILCPCNPDNHTNENTRVWMDCSCSLCSVIYNAQGYSIVRLNYYVQKSVDSEKKFFSFYRRLQFFGYWLKKEQQKMNLFLYQKKTGSYGPKKEFHLFQKMVTFSLDSACCSNSCFSVNKLDFYHEALGGYL